LISLGPSIKDVRSQGGREVCSVRTFCGQGGDEGSSDEDVRTFWLKNLQIFRNLWCVRTDEGGLSSAVILRTRGRGSIFPDFVQMSYVRPLRDCKNRAYTN